jgi:NADH:ubiquinone oxidoreductase subunit C
MDEVIKEIKARFGEKVLAWMEHSPRRLYLTLNKEEIPQVCRFLGLKLGARFSIISGIDNLKNLELLYHFSFDDFGSYVSLRTFLEREKPEIESITPMFKAAEWIEREIHELLGVNFLNHPNLTHLLLKDDWPQGNYPLRKA